MTTDTIIMTLFFVVLGALVAYMSGFPRRKK